MNSTVMIYQIASRFVWETLSLQEFERAFVPFVPYLVEHDDLGAAEQIRAIDEALIDLSIGQASVDDVRDAVRSFIATAPLVTVGAPPVGASSLSPTFTREVSFQIPASSIIQVGDPEYLGQETSARTQLAAAHG